MTIKAKNTDPGNTVRMTENLTQWFKQHARNLPWRRQRTGYTALISEAMLQQTQVSRVLEPYRRFLKRFPTVRHLAAASEQEVLTAWAGLGYYRRARFLHAAAKTIVNEYRGRIPRDTRTLLRLPGVGKYTAGAIASIVYGQRAPIVDGNIQRVLARLYNRSDAPEKSEMIKWFWCEAESLVNLAAEPGIFNEAMMELGATLCTPRQPNCAACPVQSSCLAHRWDRAEFVPPPRQGPLRIVEHHHAIIVERKGTILLEKRPSDGMWSSMWQPPTVESSTHLSPEEVAVSLPFKVHIQKVLPAFTHQTTHRRLIFHVHRGSTRIRRGEWRNPNRIDDLPMSNAHRKVLRAARVID